MGMRNCAEESCNALEFRETGYCQRHQSAMTSQIVIAKPKEIVLSLGTTTPSDNLLKWAGGLLAFGTLFILYWSDRLGRHLRLLRGIVCCSGSVCRRRPCLVSDIPSQICYFGIRLTGLVGTTGIRTQSIESADRMIGPNAQAVCYQGRNDPHC